MTHETSETRFYGVLGLNKPQQHSGSYRGGDDDDEMAVALVEETGAPGGNYQPIWPVSEKLSHIRPVPNPTNSGAAEKLMRGPGA